MSIRQSILLLICLLCFCQCEQSGTSFEKKTKDKLTVLSTTGMIDDLVRQIGGPHIQSSMLIQGDLDPHSYQLIKGDDEKLLSADIIFYNGLGLEHGTGLLIHLNEDGKGRSIGDFLLTSYPQDILYLDDHIDPHVWLDAKLWSKTIPFLVASLAEKDPQHADEYRKNGEQVQSRLLDTHQTIHSLLSSLPSQKRYLVTSHDAFQYFTRAYLADPEEINQDTWKQRCQAPEGLSPESHLSLKEIKRIIDHLKTYNIHVLFPESNINKDALRKILSAGKQAGLTIHIAQDCLFADAMGPPGSCGDSYIKMLLHDAKQIYDNLNTR